MHETQLRRYTICTVGSKYDELTKFQVSMSNVSKL